MRKKKMALSTILLIATVLNTMPINVYAQTEGVAQETNLVQEEPGVSGEEETETSVGEAQIGDINYSSLENAFNAVQSGETIKLLDDVEITKRIDIKNNAEYTLDLNGHTLTNNINEVAVALYFHFGNVTLTNSQKTGEMRLNAPQTSIVAQVGVTLNLENIKVVGTYEKATIAFIQSLGTVNVGEGTNIENYGYGIYVSRPNSTLNMESGVIKSRKSAAVNGNGSETNKGTIINISGGELYSEEGPAMYLPQIESVTNITGGTISGVTGIEIRAGELNVSGSAKIIGTANKTEANKNDNGFTTTGVGIAVAQHTTKQPVIVNVTGGTISGYTPFYESNPQGNDPLEGVNLNIAGGTFIPANGGTKSIYSEDCKGFISGGTFSDEVAKEYLAKGVHLVKNEDGTFSAEETMYAAIGDTKYPSLEKAIAAAKEGDVIKVLENVELAETLVIDKAVTLDLQEKTVKGQVQINNAEVTITNGTLSHNGADEKNATLLVLSGKTIITDSLKVEATANEGTYGKGKSAAIAVYGELEADGTTVNSNDWGIIVYNSAQVDFKDMIVHTGGNPISTAAAYSNQDMKVTIHSGEYKCIAPTGAWNYSAIYWASHGTLDIKGGTFTSGVLENGKLASTSLYAKNGTINIEGGDFVGSRDGIKIASENTDSTEIHLTVTGGTFEGTRSGFYVKTTSGGAAKDNYSVNIDGGTFYGEECSFYGSFKTFLPEVDLNAGSFEGVLYIKDEPITGFVNGGEYSDKNVLNYLAEDKAALYGSVEHLKDKGYTIQSKEEAENGATVRVTLPNGTSIYVEDKEDVEDLGDDLGIGNLTPNEIKADYADLKEKIESFEQYNQDEYKKLFWEVFSKALTDAKAMVEAGTGYSQNEVNAMADKLQNAAGSLEPKEETIINFNGELGKVYDGKPVAFDKANIRVKGNTNDPKYEFVQVVKSKEDVKLPVNVGSYKLIITVDTDENYKAATKEIPFGITSSQTNIEVSTDKQEYVYGDKIEFSVKVQPKEASSKRINYANVVSISFNDKECAKDRVYENEEKILTVDTTKLEGLGELNSNIKFTIQYSGNENLDVKEVTKDVRLNKVESNIQINTSLTKEYDGNAVVLDDKGYKVTGSKGKVSIVYQDKNGKEIAAPKDAGSYKVVVSVEADNFYNGASATKEFNIRKATLTPEEVENLLPTNIQVKVGKSLKDIELPEGLTWAEPETVLGDIGEHEYKAVYLVDEENYNPLNVRIKVTVCPTTAIINQIPIIVAEDVTLTVCDKFDPLKDVTATDKEDGDITLTLENVIENDVDTSKAGTYKVTYKVTDSKGASSTRTIKVTVNEKDTPLVPSEPDKSTQPTKPNGEMGAPETGDQTNVGFFAFAFAMSAIAIVILEILKKRIRN